MTFAFGTTTLIGGSGQGGFGESGESSIRNAEDLVFERGIDVRDETVRFWWHRFGPMFAADIRRQRFSRMRAFRQWRWHLYGAYVKMNGETHYLWRVVDREGEVLESYVTR